MRKIHNYDTTLEELLDCPFCGSEPVAFLQGNEHTMRIKITVKCPRCLVQRTTGSIHGEIEWLEGKAIALWNNRTPLKSN